MATNVRKDFRQFNRAHAIIIDVMYKKFTTTNNLFSHFYILFFLLCLVHFVSDFLMTTFAYLSAGFHAAAYGYVTQLEAPCDAGVVFVTTDALDVSVA